MAQQTDRWHEHRDALAPLFVPGDRPDRIHKAASRGARVVVIDLEDAVAGDAKPRARAAAATALSDRWPGTRYLVRVNALGSESVLAADLAALEPVLAHVDGLVLPKIGAASEVRRVEALVRDMSDSRPALVPTIESARGVRNAWEIAGASDAVATLLFGPVDLSAELGVDLEVDAPGLVVARSTVVLACAESGIASPIDGPWTNLDDTVGLARATAHARSLGFGGKIAIHPSQVGVVEAGFAPTDVEKLWAEEVLVRFDEAVQAGVGVARLPDGTFIDPPVATRARRILELAERVGS